MKFTLTASQGMVLFGALAAFAGALAPNYASAAMLTVQAASGQDAQIQSDVNHQLNPKRLRGVTGKVQDGVVTLTGTVSVYADKMDAAKRVHKIPNIASIDNRILVDGPEVSDQELGQKLSQKLAYDREGYGTLMFNAITLSVKNGVVTLGGMVVLQGDKDSAESLVTDFAGVKDMVDNIAVAALSPNDNRIRQAEARAIYGYAPLLSYAIDPVKPIRIIVADGNVTLVGTVRSQSDKEQVYMRANGVGGVFKVTNDLQVAGQATNVPDS